MKRTLTLAAVATVALAGTAEARDQIRIVGSSTVFPFTTAVAEQFSRTSGFASPIVESTGTGGGMRFFCAGVGEEHPDFTGASRPMQESEFQMCQENGVTEITEMKIGYDGIVLANAAGSEHVDLTKEQLFSALAAEVEVDGEVVPNPHQTWADIDPSLPDIEIEVLGPPPTSGTRDAFVELVMEEACGEFPAIAALPEDRMDAVCATMREDGRFVEAGENDNLIVQRLQSNPAAFGIFGFSFLDQNQDVLSGNLIGGIEPTFENIASGDYGVSRSLFVYVKNAHAGVIPGVQEFLAEYTSDAALGEDGYLLDKGLIPLPEDEAAEMRQTVMNLVPMTM
ncbi:MAG: substrate-binding domain-containing protein [Inquilinaceae bacterium]